MPVQYPVTRVWCGKQLIVCASVELLVAPSLEHWTLARVRRAASDTLMARLRLAADINAPARALPLALNSKL